MKINTKTYFEEAKKRGLEPFVLSYSTSTETSVSVFNGEVEAQQIGTTQDISGKGIFEGKIGSFSTDAIDADTPSLLTENVLNSAKFGKEDKEENFFKGGLEYKKAETDLPDFKPATLKEIRTFALELCKKVQERDPRISKTDISISMVSAESHYENSYGVFCEDSAKTYFGYISVVCEDETKEPRSGGWSFRSFHSLDDLAKEAEKVIDLAVHSAVDFFNTKPCKSKKYKAVLAPSCVASLMPFYMSQLNAKSVHKHLSVFENKVDEKIMSDCITIEHTPHITSTGSSSYDADGYPTQDFTLIDNGVLKTYFYSVETANEENKNSNGCCAGNGNGGYFVLSLKPGTKTQEELFETMQEGIYITEISGLNSGINDQTLDFSLPCQGYLIEGGKIVKAVSMIICAGNLKELFESVVDVANDTRSRGGINTPSLFVSSLAISGE